MLDDSLPTILRDLVDALDAELMDNPTLAVEFPKNFSWPKGKDFFPQTPTETAPADSATPQSATTQILPQRGIVSTSPASVPTPPAPPAPPPRAAAPTLVAVPEVALAAANTSLDELASQLATCSACPLANSRTRVVPGEGNTHAPEVMFIGEIPRDPEDAAGRPFVDAGGELLTKMIGAMGYSREQVYITYLTKCRAESIRRPLPNEISACLPHLAREIALIQPKTIVALGETVAQNLLHSSLGINSLRGKWALFQGIPLMPTYHPNYLLKMPVQKRATWADLKMVMAKVAELK